MSLCGKCACFGAAQIVEQVGELRHYQCQVCHQFFSTVEMDPAEIYRLQAQSFYAEQRAADLQLEVELLKRARQVCT